MDLPGVKSVSSVDLEVFERKLELAVENPRYVLDVSSIVRVFLGTLGGSQLVFSTYIHY